MRFPLRVSPISLLFLAVCAVATAAVSFVAVHARESSRRDDGDGPTISKRPSTRKEINARALVEANPIAMINADKATVAFYSMQSLDVSVEGRLVTVAAGVAIRERRPGMQFHWSLFVHNEAIDTRFVSRHYDDQVFSVPVTDAVSPTFSDTVRLLPGTYQVEVVLHKIPAGFDLSRLNDTDTERSTRAVSKFVKVTIPK